MMSQPFAHLGMWVWETGRERPDVFCEKLRENKVAWVAVKGHDGTANFNPDVEIKAWRDAAKANGLDFGIWGILYGNNPAREAEVAACRVNDFGAAFYLADAEQGYEGSHGDSAAFCGAFRHAHPHLPAALSSFGRIDLHSINWRAWEQASFDFMPQAYECDSSALKPGLCVDAALKAWPRSRIYVTVGTYAGACGMLSGERLYDSVRNIPLPGVNIWDAQELHTGQLEALAHLVHGAPSNHHGLMFPLDPPRDLRLTSPLMQGQDVKDLQEAINIWSRTHGQPLIDEDGVFGQLTLHMTGVTAESEGLLDTRPVKATIKKIWHPWMRTPSEKKRALAREHHDPARYGLAAVPVIAANHIGVKENPPGSNEGHPYPTLWEEHFGLDGVPWCGCFAGSCVLAAGGHVTTRVAFVPFIEDDAKRHVNGFDAWTTDHGQAGPGWLVLYNWQGQSEPEHVGVVEKLESDHVTAIEGNTDDMVARRDRRYELVVGYARPRF